MSAVTKYPHVFRPITIGCMTLKNRIQYSPLVSNHAETLSGASNNDLLAFVGAQARSGVGLVTIGSTPIDFDRARDFYGCLSVTRDTDIAGLSLLADEVHRYGAKISIELTHAGAISNFTYAERPGVRALGHPRHPQPRHDQADRPRRDGRGQAALGRLHPAPEDGRVSTWP